MFSIEREKKKAIVKLVGKVANQMRKKKKRNNWKILYSTK